MVYSLIGAAIIVVGLYSLIWGKSKDHLGGDGKPGAGAAATELPLTSAPTANGNGKQHALGGHVVADVETPATVTKCAY